MAHNKQAVVIQKHDFCCAHWEQYKYCTFQSRQLKSSELFFFAKRFKMVLDKSTEQHLIRVGIHKIDTIKSLSSFPDSQLEEIHFGGKIVVAQRVLRRCMNA